MADTVHERRHALRGRQDAAMWTKKARQAAAMYESGATWKEMREALECSFETLSSLLHEGGVTVGTRRPDLATIVHPERTDLAPIDRWTQELQRAPSPCMEAALAKHTAAIHRLHAELGLEAPVLP